MMRAELRQWRVESVIVGPMAHQDQAVALLTDLLGRPPQADEGVLLWLDVGTVGS
jgi:hypothetical protein